MRHLLPPLVAAASLLSGCTSTGGGGASPSMEIGRRAVPGYEVVVTREAGAAPGVYRVDLAGAAPRAVDAWVACCGYDPDAATRPAEAISGVANAWRMTLPSSGRLWVRITDADGNLLEVGGDDFPVE